MQMKTPLKLVRERERDGEREKEMERENLLASLSHKIQIEV